LKFTGDEKQDIWLWWGVQGQGTRQNPSCWLNAFFKNSAFLRHHWCNE
jgi:hypothetical protein